MRSYCPKAVLVCILALLTLACVGCGGSGNVNANGNGSSSTPPPTQPSNLTINGFWYINMGTSQAGRHINPNPGPTEIGISLVQNGSVLTTDKPVYLYCTCLGDATSTRVAQRLQEKGVRVAVIKGGLRAWKKAGLPLEPVPPEEMTKLPVFE